MTDPMIPVNCALPDCGAQLHLTRIGTRALYTSDIAEGAEPIAADDNYVTEWQVGCEEGHVLLTPGDAGCGCVGDCEHGANGDDGYDWSDEYRTFRPRDAARLRELLAKLESA